MDMWMFCSPLHLFLSVCVRVHMCRSLQTQAAMKTMTFKPVDGPSGEGMNSLRLKHLLLSPASTRIQPWFQIDYRLVGCQTTPCGANEHGEATMKDMPKVVFFPQQVRNAKEALLLGYKALSYLHCLGFYPAHFLVLICGNQT